MDSNAVVYIAPNGNLKDAASLVDAIIHHRLNVNLVNGEIIENVTYWSVQHKEIFGICYEFKSQSMDRYHRIYQSLIKSITIL